MELRINFWKQCVFIAVAVLLFGCVSSNVQQRPQDNDNVRARRVDSFDGLQVADTQRTIVSTRYGLVEGAEDLSGALVWKGIPFAAPPERFASPEEPAPWEGFFDARETGSKCAQLDRKSGELVGSEDCLVLNVWRPDTDEQNLPVYFWIHGGGNNNGSASTLNGAELAQRAQVIVVATQYRLGPLGWLTHPDLRSEVDPLTASGNYGLLDILQALKWVKDNIHSFGGDADNVTIAGGSAGGRNVLSLVASPVAAGLFHRAIAQSAGTKTLSIAEGDAKTESTINVLLQSSGMDELQADVKTFLQDVPAKDLFSARISSGVDFSFAHADGNLLPDDGVLAAIRSGHYNKVPIILGSNRDEVKYFMPHFGPILKNAADVPQYGIHKSIPSGESLWSDLLKVLAGGLSLDDVLPNEEDKALYQACAETGSLNWRFSAVDNVARAMNSHQNNIYAYQLRWDGADGSPYQFVFGAAHATEIPFFWGGASDIFGGAAYGPGYDSLGRQQLSATMMDYVSSFVWHGDPNRLAGLPRWQQWSNKPGDPKTISLDAGIKTQEIGMLTEEVTLETVNSIYKTRYTALPESVRNALYFFKWDRQ